MCLRGCRARVRGPPFIRQVIASPVTHGWLMVWADRIVVVVYESGGLRRGGPHIHQPSSCPSSTCSGQGGDAQRHCPRPLKVTGTALTTRRRRTVHAQDSVAAPTTPPCILAAGHKATQRMALHLQTLVPGDTPRVQRTTRYEATPPRTTACPILTHPLFSQRVRNTQSWYRVEHPNYSRQGPHDRDTEYYSYSEEGSDRLGRSDAQPFHTYTDSESASRVESPVPTVHRQEAPGLGSRLFEQFPGGRPPPGPPASVTRLDLPQEEDRGFDGGGGFDRRQRAAYPVASQYPHRQSFAPDPRRPNQPHRRPSQHSAYQVCVACFIADTFPFISFSRPTDSECTSIYIYIPTLTP